LIALNPPPISGTLRSVDPESNVQIENAELDKSRTDESDFQDPDALRKFLEFNGCIDSEQGFETHFLVYQPSYNEYQNPPATVLEHSLLYNDFNSEQLPISKKGTIDNSSNRINIVLYNGTVSRSSSQSISLDPKTIDGPTAPVPIKPVGSEPITVKLPTRTSGPWGEDDGGTAQIKLKNEPYTIRMSRVGFTDEADAECSDIFTPVQTTSSTTNEEPPSFTVLEAEESKVSGSQREVEFNWEVSGGFDQITLDTESDGPVTRADRSGTETLEADPGEKDITATVEGPGGTETCTTTIGNGESKTKSDGDFTC
jgi:hypothetical protein